MMVHFAVRYRCFDRKRRQTGDGEALVRIDSDDKARIGLDDPDHRQLLEEQLAK